jgi:tartrate dehydratase alpha subunit/fumarate hydratase class I-like protein
MRNQFMFASVIALTLLSQTTLAAESGLRDDAKKVGHETGEVMHKIGEGAREFGKKVAAVAVEVGHATRDGAKELVRALKGESDSKNSGAASNTHQHKRD